MPGITKKEVANLQGKKVFVFRFSNNSEAYVELINYGATLISVVVPDKFGKRENVVLCYENIEDYFSDSFYLGSTVGRFANRIAGAQFKINGKTYWLDKNDGSNSNHGGFHGFNTKVFDCEIQNNKIIFFYESKDGEGGFPGKLNFSVTYSFSENNELNIEYKVISDKETIFNPTNHAYFDLSAGKSDPLDNELKVFADSYLESNNQFLPTGNILPVAGTPFDFSQYKEIGELMLLKKEILEGYNTYFIGKKTPSGMSRLLASLKDNCSGRILHVYSDMPGVQFYTGDYLSAPHKPFAGLCLEAQSYPDAPNHLHFPSCQLSPDSNYTYHIQYKFEIDSPESK